MPSLVVLLGYFFGLIQEVWELFDDLVCFGLGSILELFGIRKVSELGEVWQQLCNENIVYKVKQKWLVPISSNHVHFSKVGDLLSIANCDSFFNWLNGGVVLLNLIIVLYLFNLSHNR